MPKVVGERVSHCEYGDVRRCEEYALSTPDAYSTRTSDSRTKLLNAQSFGGNVKPFTV